MASTNKTTNYELSQYIGSDKPTYLGDYNSDMLKIDTAMHTNATAIVTADEKATTAGTNANTALTNASNAQTTADTANSTANSALTKAISNETKITALETANSYSRTEEIVTGTWIDGKPLYRKTVVYTVSIGTGWNNVAYIPNVDYVFIENFTYKKVLTGSNLTELYLNNYGAFQFYWSSTDSYVKEKHTTTYAENTQLEITFQYTKTTD